jgi:hypothetical protein
MSDPILHDGYASGLADIIRHMDNAGKTPRVLATDFISASLCAKKRHIATVADLEKVTNPALAIVKEPFASTAGIIFEALRACGATNR